MKSLMLAFAVLLIAACATPYDPKEIEAVRDYVAVAELQSVDQIRLYREMSYSYLNDVYVIIPGRRQSHLVELGRICRELRETEFRVDMIDQRVDTNILRARFDTIRGCRIAALYELTDAQVKELRNLGDAPGEEVFLPDDDK